MKTLHGSLDLRQTRVTDAGLAQLKRTEKPVGTPAGDSTQLTDAGLANLKELKGLGTLSLSPNQR